MSPLRCLFRRRSFADWFLRLPVSLKGSPSQRRKMRADSGSLFDIVNLKKNASHARGEMPGQQAPLVMRVTSERGRPARIDSGKKVRPRRPRYDVIVAT